MNPRKLVLKAAAVFLAAMTLFSSAANAEVVNTAEVSRSYYASHGDYKVPLQVDETYQIKIKNAKEDIKYISNDDTIATVSDTGIITAKKPGTCKVRASYGNEIYLYLPDNIERIDVEAFSGCKNLKLHYKGKVYNTSSKKDMNSLSYYNIVYKNGWRQVRK